MLNNMEPDNFPVYFAYCNEHICRFTVFFIYRLDCGTGPGAVRTSGKVRLNHWNRLTVFRHDWGVWLQLNGGRHDEGRSQVN